MNRLVFLSGLVRAATVAIATEAAAQQESVVARVNGDAVMSREIDREVNRVVGRRKVDAPTRARIRAGTIEQVIDRRLVHRWLERTDRGATAAEIDQHAQRIKQDLAERKRDWAAHLKEQDLTDDEWRLGTAWRIAWTRYVADQFDDAALKKYFERRRRDFDGTEIRVRHLLLRTEDKDSARATETLVAKAAAIREEIASGKSPSTRPFDNIRKPPRKTTRATSASSPATATTSRPFPRPLLLSKSIKSARRSSRRSASTSSSASKSSRAKKRSTTSATMSSPRPPRSSFASEPPANEKTPASNTSSDNRNYSESSGVPCTSLGSSTFGRFEVFSSGAAGASSSPSAIS